MWRARRLILGGQLVRDERALERLVIDHARARLALGGVSRPGNG